MTTLEGVTTTSYVRADTKLKTIWLDQYCDYIRQKAGEGWSVREVVRGLSDEFKFRTTKNAVIGKAQRLKGITWKASVFTPTHTERRVKVRRQYKPRPRQKFFAPVVGPNPLAEVLMAKQPEPLEEPIDRSLWKTFEDLGANDCKWPVADSPEFKFCGRKRLNDHVPYCFYHCRVAYQPPRR